MAHFLVEYREIGTPQAREDYRGDHVAYRKGLGAALCLTGPILDDGEKPIGSLIIIDAADKAQAEQIALRDPYLAAGVFELASVRGYRIAAMKPPVAAA